MQHQSSSQADGDMFSRIDCSLLPAWGSQEHTGVHVLVDPEDVSPLMCSSTAAATQQLGQYLDAATAAVGMRAATKGLGHEAAGAQGSLAGQPAAPATVQEMQHLQQQQHQFQLFLQQQQHQLQQGLVAGALEQQDLEQLNRQLQQQVTYSQQDKQQQQEQQRSLQVPQQQLGHYAVQPSHQQLLQHQQHQQHQQLREVHRASQPGGLFAVPALDLTRVKVGSSAIMRNLPDGEPVSQEEAQKDAELCFEHGSIRQHQLHPQAPLQDSRCYIYRAAGRQELTLLHDLLSRLPQRECGEVLALWDALMVARHDCEMMAARGVRVSRDISRDWQETVSDLIDRVVAQDNELGQLRQQLKAAQAAAAAPNPSAGSAAGVDELHAQVVRLKRQRDRLTRDQQEMGRALTEAQEATQLAQQEAAAAKERCASLSAKAAALRDQHASLLRQHIELATYTESLQAAALESMAFPALAAAQPDQPGLDQTSSACKSPSGSFIITAGKGSSGHRSPFGGYAGAGSMTNSSMPAGLQALADSCVGEALGGPTGRNSPSASRMAPGLAVLIPQARAVCSNSTSSSKSSPRSGMGTFNLTAGSIAAAFSYKLAHTAAALAGGKGGSGRNSGASTPAWPGVGGAAAGSAGSLSSMKGALGSAATAAGSNGPAGSTAGAAAPAAGGGGAGSAGAAAGNGGSSKPRTSLDTPDTSHDRINSSHSLAAVREVDQQLPVVPLGVLGGGAKAPSRLVMQRVGSPRPPAAVHALAVPLEGMCRQQPDWRGAIEAAQQQLEAVNAMSF